MDIAIFITLLIISYRSSRSIRNSSEILNEFKQSNILSFFVFIYPIGPLLLFAGNFIPLIILYPLAFACFVPQLVIARTQLNALNQAGTDRVNEAIKALSLASLGAIVGLIYLSVGLVIAIATHNVAASYY